MCCCSDEFGEAWFQERTCLGFLLSIAFIGVGFAIAMSIVSIVVVYQDTETINSIPATSRLSPARIIPQMYDMNNTRLGVGQVRVQEDADFRMGLCREFAWDGVGEMLALVQMDISPGGLPPRGMEMRFEVPIVESTMKEASILRRCPSPKCSAYDYRTGIGPGGGQQNAYATFWTEADVSWNRRVALPYPVVCGCSGEDPVRFSCTISIPTPPVTMAGNSTMHGGSMQVWLHFVYPIDDGM